MTAFEAGDIDTATLPISVLADMRLVLEQNLQLEQIWAELTANAPQVLRLNRRRGFEHHASESSVTRISGHARRGGRLQDLQGWRDAESKERKTIGYAGLRLGFSTKRGGTQGRITEFRVWNRSRTAEEIRADFTGVSNMPEGLLEAMQPEEVADLFAHLESLTGRPQAASTPGLSPK